MRTRAIFAALVVVLAACGSGTKATPLATPASAADSLARDSTAKAAATTARKLASGPHHVFDTAAAAGARPLVRETYHYESSSLRDPFKPYMEQVERGPELADLRLVALLYDANDPSGSMATFRDIGNDQRYTLVPGQRLGRISVVSVTENTVKLRMDDFGTMRDQTYSMRKPGDQKP
jgi:hypothetical protein